jgi:serine protease Do
VQLLGDRGLEIAELVLLILRRKVARKIASMVPGTSVKLDIMHNGNEKIVSLTLRQLPDDRQALAGNPEHETSESGAQHLGLTLAPANETCDGDRGVAITAVDPNGPAAEHGVRIGDIILDVAGTAVSSPADVRKELADLRKAGKHTVLMRMKSSDTTRFVALPLGNA